MPGRQAPTMQQDGSLSTSPLLQLLPQEGWSLAAHVPGAALVQEWCAPGSRLSQCDMRAGQGDAAVLGWAGQQGLLHVWVAMYGCWMPGMVVAQLRSNCVRCIWPGVFQAGLLSWITELTVTAAGPWITLACMNQADTIRRNSCTWRQSLRALPCTHLLWHLRHICQQRKVLAPLRAKRLLP